MNTLINSLKKSSGTNLKKTENGMPAFQSSGAACLDLFFLGGSYRQRSETEILQLFNKAFRENSSVALLILAYFRDARQGIGERKFFRTCIKHLAETEIDFNLSYIPELGRWDDLLSFIDTPYQHFAFTIIRDALTGESPNSLCAKWMPRKGRSARLLREFLGLYPKQYRNLLVSLTKVVETQMCSNEWENISYKGVPSMANIKYNNAFLRHDEVRRRSFLEDVKTGKVTINASVAMPHEIVSMLLKGGTGSIPEGELLGRILKKNDTAIAMWKNLTNTVANPNKRMLACSDTSGSMGRPYSKDDNPIKISLAMGIYLSERLEGPFQNAFITFSRNPTLQYTEGDLYERLSQIRAYHPSNTDIQAVFKLVLDTAISASVSEDEMPTDIMIISDMEFDRATGNPNDNVFAMIRKMYADAGYDMPNLIFWNVNAKNDHLPIGRNSKGVALISGASHNAIKAVMNGITTPMDVMLDTVISKRYEPFIKPYINGRK